MRKRSGWFIGVVVLVAAAALLIALARKTTTSANAAAEIANTANDVPRFEAGLIRFAPAFAARAKIGIAPAEIASIAPSIDVTGTVTFDAGFVAAVGSRIPGRVRHVARIEGDYVKKGDTLAEIESADLGQAQAAVIAARAHSEAADSNDARTTALTSVHAASEREAEQAKAQAASSLADLRAAEQRVRAFGAAPDGEPGVLRLLAPIAGRVVERHVSRGQSVEPTLTAFVVADLSHLWVELAIFEGDLHLVRAGDDVQVVPQVEPRTPLIGKVAHVGDVLDRETRSAPVRVAIVQSEPRVRPGQSVLAHIESSRREDGRVVVPRDAVIMVDGKPTIFVAEDATSVRPRSVELGAKDGQRVAIVSGLSPGESYVRENAFALKSELFR